MARMTHGGHGDDNLRKDKQVNHNRDGMRSAFSNIPRGFDHLLGSSSPAAQARHFHDVVGELQPREFVMLDVEPDQPARVGELSVAQIAATLEAIEQEFAVTPSLYIGRFYTSSLDTRLHREDRVGIDVVGRDPGDGCSVARRPVESTRGRGTRWVWRDRMRRPVDSLGHRRVCIAPGFVDRGSHCA